MKARYENDRNKGPGHGFLRLTDMAASASFDGVTVSVKRASDQKCLSRGGWQNAEHFLPVHGLSLTDDGVALAVGPEIVDGLDTVETFRLTLAFADGSKASGILAVPEVAYSPQAGGAGVAEAPAPPPPPPPAPEPEPEPEPEDPPRKPLPQEPPAPLPMPPQAARKSPALPLLLLILVLLLAGGGFAWWKFLPGPQEPPQAGAGTEQAPLSSPLDRARAHLSGQADPAAGLALAKELLSSPEGADAAFLLAEDAAQKGLPEAMLLAGAFYDPADAPYGSIEKDPAQALVWYTTARDKGDAGVKKEAEQKIASLKAWAQAEAAGGNIGAKSLLDTF